jgi:hypothetical protein
MRSVAIALPLILLLPAGVAFAQAPGSYRGSCVDISQDGPMLTARCRGPNGDYRETSIDLSACGGQPVANSFGRLTCGNVAGSSRPGSVAPRRRDEYGTAGPGYGSDGARRHRRQYGNDDPGYGYDAPPPRRYAPPPYGDQDD